MTINNVNKISHDGELQASQSNAHDVSTDGNWTTEIDFGSQKQFNNILLDQFWNSKILNDIPKAFIAQHPEIMRAIDDIKKMTDLNQAFGWWLDMWGKSVGEPRNSRNDIEYRKYIVFKIFLNTSTGTPDTLINFVKFYTNNESVVYTELWPAKCRLSVTGATFPTEELISYLQRLAPSGVKVLVEFSEEKAFGFDDEGGFVDITSTAFDEETVGNPDAGPIKEELASPIID